MGATPYGRTAAWRGRRSNVRESHSLLCRLGHARLESFEVVKIADANHVEVSDRSFRPTIPRQKFEKLSQPFPGLHLPKGRPENKSPK